MSLRMFIIFFLLIFYFLSSFQAYPIIKLKMRQRNRENNSKKSRKDEIANIFRSIKAFCPKEIQEVHSKTITESKITFFSIQLFFLIFLLCQTPMKQQAEVQSLRTKIKNTLTKRIYSRQKKIQLGQENRKKSLHLLQKYKQIINKIFQLEEQNLQSWRQTVFQAVRYQDYQNQQSGVNKGLKKCRQLQSSNQMNEWDGLIVKYYQIIGRHSSDSARAIQTNQIPQDYQDSVLRRMEAKELQEQKDQQMESSSLLKNYCLNIQPEFDLGYQYSECSGEMPLLHAQMMEQEIPRIDKKFAYYQDLFKETIEYQNIRDQKESQYEKKQSTKSSSLQQKNQDLSFQTEFKQNYQFSLSSWETPLISMNDPAMKSILQQMQILQAIQISHNGNGKGNNVANSYM